MCSNLPVNNITTNGPQAIQAELKCNQGQALLAPNTMSRLVSSYYPFIFQSLCNKIKLIFFKKITRLILPSYEIWDDNNLRPGVSPFFHLNFRALLCFGVLSKMGRIRWQRLTHTYQYFSLLPKSAVNVITSDITKTSRWHPFCSI